MAAPVSPVVQAPSRYWEDVPGEFDLAVTEITGKLPEGLTGTLYRNGSGRWNVGRSRVDSLFDADGMVTAFAIDRDGVRFKNRFVRTQHYLRTTAAGAMVQRGFAYQRPGGLRTNAFRQPANTANTNVLIGDEQLLALWEGGRPHGMDLDTLNTIGMCSLDGVLKGPVGAYSAHYTFDPVQDSKVNFGFEPYFPRIDLRHVRDAPNRSERIRRLRELAGEAVPRVRLRLYETDSRGTTRYVRAVPLPGMGLIHDMALTTRYAVFLVSPLRINPWAVLGHRSYWDAIEFKAEEPAYFVLAPRDGGRIRVIETDPFYMWHYANAYDDGSDVVIELPRFAPETFAGMHAWSSDTRTDLARVYDGVASDDAPNAVRMTRFRITAADRVHAEPLAELGCEFPQIDQRRSTQPHRATYVTVPSDGEGSGEGIGRFDHTTGTVQTYCPPGNKLVEPIFVPKPGTTTEDDGWILTVGYDESQHRSRLMVFDAPHIDTGPIAECWLPFHLPMSYHGAFTTRVAAL
ncbi:carotenoid oxygenase family protein [Mycolicibacterium sp. XJ870]